MNIEQERADFEAWYGKLIEPRLTGTNTFMRNIAFEAYQAGRAALQSQDREDALTNAIRKAIKLLGPEAPICSGCEYEWNHALRVLMEAIDHARRAEGNEMNTKTPYQEGAEAKRSGKTWLDCPYTDFYRRSQWFRGWGSARLIDGGGE